MSKRLIALLLSLVMVLACLVGCGKDDDGIGDAVDAGSEKTMTLSMYLMSEEPVSAEQAEKIEAAVNKITMSKFKTKLDLRYFTEEEYYAALDKAFDESATAAENEEAIKDALKEELTGTDTVAEETYVDEYGVVQLKYPTVEDYQVDIFYINGYDKLAEYIENELVQDLSSEISSASKIIKTYVHPGYLSGIDTVCDGIYAVPTNAPIGEYTYILLNKEILKEYNHTAGDFSSITSANAQHLLDHVKKYNPDYVPLRSFTDSGELDVSYVRYFGINENGKIDDSTFSLLGGAYEPSWTYMTPGEFSRCANIFNDTSFSNQLETLVKYKENGYYGTEADADKKFAMGYIKGGVEVIEEYGDEYEVLVHQTPVLDTMDLFENMFAVSSYATSLPRSMEVLSYLYTNVDFNNLLLYGIEGENYEFTDSEELDENGDPYQLVKVAKDNTYVMSPYKLGNVFLSYPTVDENPHKFEIYKAQNLDSTTSLIMGLMHDAEDLVISEPHATYIREQSAIVLEQLLAIDSVDELKAYIEEVRKLLNTDPMLIEGMRQAAITIPSEVEGEDPIQLQTIPAIYSAWVSANKLIAG